MKKYLLYLFLLFGFSFLFVTNTKAYTIATYNGITMNEELVYNKFVAIDSDFDLNEFNYIHCLYYDNNSTYRNNPALVCTALRGQDLHKVTIVSETSISIGTALADQIPMRQFTYRPASNTISSSYNSDTMGGGYSFFGNGAKSSAMSKTSVTNFTTLNDTNSVTYNNVLDFTRYSITLRFDENLFANDENFKKVCVNSNSSFSITRKHDDGVMSGSDHDFIWFPHGISGIKQFNYSTEMSNGYYEFEDPYENFYFSSYDNINAIWNTEYMHDNFESKGYTDKYKYYGYTAYLFLHWYNFNDGQTYNFFPIFEVTNNVTTTHISSSGNEHGGGGTRLDGDEEIEISDEYCFYIKNEYEVNEVILDEWGDHYVSVNTPNGPINYGTTINKDKTDSESFLSQPIKFISEMSGTITFLNANIYNLYMSMPLVVRTFLITALIIFIVMLIMKLGGYQ